MARPRSEMGYGRALFSQMPSVMSEAESERPQKVFGRPDFVHVLEERSDATHLSPATSPLQLAIAVIKGAETRLAGCGIRNPDLSRSLRGLAGPNGGESHVRSASHAAMIPGGVELMRVTRASMFLRNSVAFLVTAEPDPDLGCGRHKSPK